MQISAKNKTETFSEIKKIDEDRRIVYAAVYEPNVLDSHGDMMLAEGIEAMAHKYLSLPDLSKTIDTQHDNVPNGSYPIESFIARKDDPDFPEGSWVLGVKIPDPVVWNKVKSGELNGFSFQAMAKSLPAVVEVEIFPTGLGNTEVALDHSHYYFVEMDENGRVKNGMTSVDYGHSHEIKSGTATEEALGHAHRYFI